jgi:hypothetical protein
MIFHRLRRLQIIAIGAFFYKFIDHSAIEHIKTAGDSTYCYGELAMAKRRGPNGQVNKSAAIREIFEQDIKTPVKDVIATLAAKGVKVEPSLVYFTKGRMKKMKRKALGRSMAAAGVANPVDLILKVRGLASSAGGMSKLKALVDAMSG